MKQIAAIFLSIAVLCLFPLWNMQSKVFAADTNPWWNQTPNEYDDILTESITTKEVSKENADAGSNTNNMNLIILQIKGSGNPASAYYYKKSALAQMANAMSFTYQAPPANTYAFVQDMGQSLGFMPKKAYAAEGSGYTGLLPILPIWKGFRNIAYGLLAIAMIAVGFMIMFRKKIDPKTVMTVQNSLPRIVVTLVLITFSYAIAGFLIDLMYVLILIGTRLLLNSGMEGMNAEYLQTEYLNGGFWALFAGVFQPLWNFFNAPLDTTINQVVSGQFLEAIGTVLKTFGFYASGVGPFFLLLICLAYVFIFVRLLFTLFSCYIQILMGVIFAPLQLLADIFPGSNQTTNWFKNMIANLLAFPITIFLLILGDALSRSFGEGALWEPPLLNTGSPITDSGGVAYLGQVLIWFGILSSIPSIIGSVKELFKAKPAVQAGAGAALAPIAMAIPQGLQIASQGLMIKDAFGKWRRKPDTNPVESLQDVARGR